MNRKTDKDNKKIQKLLEQKKEENKALKKILDSIDSIKPEEVTKSKPKI